MRKNFGAQPYLYPQPVLIVASYDIRGNVNAMNAAWGGLCEHNHVRMCLNNNHRTVQNILRIRAFSISIGTASKVVECDYLGIVSGNKEHHKMEKAGLTTKRSEFINAPIINEFPLTLECKLKSYDLETGDMVGEIVNVSADESILTNGQIDPAKLEAICYDPVNHYYLKIGEKVGVAFEDGEKLK